MTNVIQSLNGGGKRARVHDAQIVAKVPARAKELVGQIAKDREVSDSTVVREALAEYFEKRGYRA